MLLNERELKKLLKDNIVRKPGQVYFQRNTSKIFIWSEGRNTHDTMTVLNVIQHTLSDLMVVLYVGTIIDLESALRRMVNTEGTASILNYIVISRRHTSNGLTVASLKNNKDGYLTVVIILTRHKAEVWIQPHLHGYHLANMDLVTRVVVGMKGCQRNQTMFMCSNW